MAKSERDKDSRLIWPRDKREAHTCLYHAQVHLIAYNPDAREPVFHASPEYDIRCACRIMQACADLVDLTQ
jgi:hypothetical protein